jgi:hypothetical protein
MLIDGSPLTISRTLLLQNGAGYTTKPTIFHQFVTPTLRKTLWAAEIQTWSLENFRLSKVANFPQSRVVTAIARSRCPIQQNVPTFDVPVEHFQIVQLLQSKSHMVQYGVLSHINHASVQCVAEQVLIPRVVVFEEGL